jgi:hypothetical protein
MTYGPARLFGPDGGRGGAFDGDDAVGLALDTHAPAGQAGK